MSDWPAGEVRAVRVETLGESYRRYRLPDAAGDRAMARSLERYGQLAPIVVWLPSRQLGQLLHELARMEHWLRHRGRADVTAHDQQLLRPSWEKLTRDAQTVAELAGDLIGDEVLV